MFSKCGMGNIRFFVVYTLHTMAKLCQRRWLLAGLALLCLLLAVGIGPAMQAMLSSGISFSGLTLALAAPEGDSTPELVEEYASMLADVNQYCTFLSLEEEDAIEALKAGEVTAVLVLPEDFIEGIMDGTNPDVRLLVPGDRPLESLLTLWVGQSATDLLAAVQAGIYAVLDFYDAASPEGISRDQVMMRINLEYISWTLNRQDMFRTETVTATQQLPVSLHYGLTLLVYCGFTAAPLFTVIYGRSNLVFRRRLRSLGKKSGFCWLCDVTACTFLLFLLMAVPAFLLLRDSVLPVLGATLAAAVFCSIFGILCCQLTTDAAACGGLSFFLALLFTAAGGGILPPVLLPETLRNLSWLSPSSWLRMLLSTAAGFEADRRMLIAMAIVFVLMSIAGLLLCRRRVMRQEAAE